MGHAQGLVAAMFVYIAAAMTAQALLAVRGHAWSALAWMVGAVVYLKGDSEAEVSPSLDLALTL